MKTLLLLPLLIISFFLSAQHEVLFLNGRVYTANTVEIDSHVVKFTFQTAKGRLREKITPHEDVFSVRYPGNRESVLYVPGDTSEYLSVEQMRLYVTGHTRARELYKPWKDILIGSSTGLLAGYFLNSYLLGVAIPPALAVANGLLPVSMNRISSDPLYSSSYYQAGYKKQTKKARFATTLLSCTAGIFTGLLISKTSD